MSQGAQVRSVDAIRDFLAALQQFREDGQEALCSADMEIRRMQDWLREQLKSWSKEVRDCEEELIQAKNELSRRQTIYVGDKPPDCTEQKKRVQFCRARLEHAEEKVATTRRWIPEMDRLNDEYYGPARQLAGFLDSNMLTAFAVLERKIAALEAYLALTAPTTARDAGGLQSAASDGNAPGPTPSPAVNPTSGAK
jgi:DNA repair exonuclease SbcCD ATPase subunit